MQQKKDDILTGKQKAAIFLVAVGADNASLIFKHLHEDEVEELTLEISRLGKIESEVKDQVLIEFEELALAHKFISQGGIEYARAILEKALGQQKAAAIMNRLTASLQVRPFDFIRKTDPKHLLTFIKDEHPQTIALILSYLDSDKASIVLAELDPEVQTDVSRRIATMDRTSPDTLREVERVLERRLSVLAGEDYATTGGIDQIVDILNNVDRATEKQIIESLEDKDPELAEEIKKRMFVFEDIINLDDRAIQEVIKQVDTSELSLALKAVSDDVKDKIFHNMSKRAASMLAEDMEYMGPVRMKDVEEAQQKIVNVIRRLEEAGEIVISRGEGEEIVV